MLKSSAALATPDRRAAPPARFRPALALALLLLAVGLALVRPAEAASRFASLLIDVGTGEVLQQANADLPRYPASLTKMMTLYLAFQALDDGRWSLDQPLWVSARAAEQAPTKLGLRPGDTISVEDALLALITKSANDAAAVVAENLAGSESGFASRMTAKASALGMSQTVFRNASGLPDPYQITTARDMATLALALIHHYPHYYHYFSTKHFYFNGRAHANHNHLLGVYDGVDGIKTGFTRASGFNLVASAQRDGRRLIGVVLGAPSSGVRNTIMADLLDQAFGGVSEIQVAGLDGSLAGGEQYAAGRLRGDIASAREEVAYAAAASALVPARTTRSATRAEPRAVASRSATSRSATSRNVASRSATSRNVASRSERRPAAQARGAAQVVPVVMKPASGKAAGVRTAATRAAPGKAVTASRAVQPAKRTTQAAQASKAKPAVAVRPVKAERSAVTPAVTKAAAKAPAKAPARKPGEQTRLARR
jgi:D-alanyl-D-alanine carboxypeptidase